MFLRCFGTKCFLAISTLFSSCIACHLMISFYPALLGIYPGEICCSDEEHVYSNSYSTSKLISRNCKNSCSGSRTSRKAELWITLKSWRSLSNLIQNKIPDFGIFAPFDFMSWMILACIATGHRFFRCPRILRSHQWSTTERHSQYIFFLKAGKQLTFFLGDVLPSQEVP